MLLGRPSSSVVLYAAVTLLLAFNGLYLLSRFSDDAGAAPAPGSAIEYPLYGTLIAFGDSITQGGSSTDDRGFVARLADIYTRRLDVLNRGFSGYTSRDALSVAPMVFPAMPLQRKSRLAAIQRALGLTPAPEDLMFPERPQPPHLCLIFFGTNDARAAPNAQHVPLEDFRANIRRLVALLRDPASAHYSPKTRILLITPPAVGDRMMDELARRDGRHPGWRNAVTKYYAQAVMEAAEEAKLPAIDLWTWIEDLVHGNAATDGLSFRVNAEGDFTATDFGAGGLDAASEPSPFEGYERFLSDGLHLNAGGNELLYRLIIAKIRDAWPELSPRMKPATKPQLVAHV